METALIIAGINAAVTLLQTQMQLAAAQAAVAQGQERQALLSAMQAAYTQATALNSTLAKTLADHGILAPKEPA
jgi:hypothetical protein